MHGGVPGDLRTVPRAQAAPAPSSAIDVREPARSAVDAKRRGQTDPQRPPPDTGPVTVPNPPLVSVLLTSYNREAFIAESIESVLAQTLTDFELIVSDDQSHDATVAIAQSYARRDPRVRVSVNEKNLGDYA